IAAEPSLRTSITDRILALSTAFAKRSSVVPMGADAASPTAPTDARGRPAIGVSTPNLVLATVGIIAFALVYYLILWIYVLPLGPVVLAVGLSARRLWSAARGGHDYVLVNPVRPEHRLYLWQALGRLALWVLVAFISLPTLGSLDYLIADDTARALQVGFWI